MSSRTASYYQEHHSRGEGRYGFTIAADARGSWFAEEIRRLRGNGPLRVLDVGCRDGTLTKIYSEGCDVVGLDIDPQAVKLARERGLDAREHDLNQANLPFDDGSFDVVVAGEVLEHLQFPDVVASDIHRVLRSKGTFLGSVPNAFRLRNRLTFLLGDEFEVDPTHLHQFSPGAVTRFLKDFVRVRLDFQGGRRRGIHPRLFATQLCWAATKA